MVRISKHKVKKDILLQISEKLIEQIANAKTKKHAQHFLMEFFTETERIMFAKRFAILFMLERGYSYSIIVQTLKVSYSTIAHIKRGRIHGKFDFLVQQIEKCTKGRMHGFSNSFWKYLEELIGEGLPPRGRGRWRTLYRITEDNYLNAKNLRR